jgi:uncharacterized membrane protein YozB (DUF420 family)
MTTQAHQPRPRYGWLLLIGVLVAVIVAFAIRRVVVDVPNMLAGAVPDRDSPDRQYALHPTLAFVHIALGVIYLLGAPVQLWRPFRERHYQTHRRLGRALVGLGLVCGCTGVVFGARFAFGGSAEGVASAMLGGWFVTSLSLAFLAIRRGDVVRHRRWMLRAFVMGLAVGTIRIWIGLFTLTGLLTLPDRFAVSFWIAFLVHLTLGEWWLTTHPHPAEARRLPVDASPAPGRPAPEL